jgi:hypothetical protein
MNHHSYSHLIFYKVAKNMMEKRQPLQQMLMVKLEICLQKTETRSCFSPCTSINSKWIKDFNIRPETLKLVQERAGNTLETIGIDKDFLSRTQVAQELRERMDKWDYVKLKKLLHNKRNGL